MNAIVQLLVKHGYSVLFASVFARQMCLPVPSILFLIAAGALAGAGRMTLALALGLALIACWRADMGWYEAGRRWGDQILHFIYGLALNPDAAARRSKETFVRHGPRTLMLAKFVVGLDAATPSLAGLSGISRFRFIAFDAVGAALWSGAYAGLGYVLGKDLDRVAAYAVRLCALWVTVVFVALAVYVGRKLVQWHRIVREFRMARISPEELKQKLDAGEQVMIVDLHGRRDVREAITEFPARCASTGTGLDSTIIPRRERRSLAIARSSFTVLPWHEFTGTGAALELRRRGFQRVRPLAGGL